MKGIWFDGELQYREDLPVPVRSENESLIKVVLTAVCNTDKEIVKGYKGFKGILGHEFVGIVEDSADKTNIGRRVVGEINIGCGQCGFCRKGLPNHCINRKVLGIMDKDGAFAEYLTLPNSNLNFVPDTVSDFEAVFAEPLAAALQISEKCHIKPSSRVAIIGDGKLAQMIAQVISLTACDLTVIGKHMDKLDFFKSRAHTVLFSEANYSNCFDVVIDCTGNDQGILYAGKLVKAGGTIVLKSTYLGEAKLNPTDWVVNEINVVGTRCGPITASLRLLERKLVSVEQLVSAVYTLEDYQEAFESRNAGKPVFKI